MKPAVHWLERRGSRARVRCTEGERLAGEWPVWAVLRWKQDSGRGQWDVLRFATTRRE